MLTTVLRMHNKNDLLLETQTDTQTDRQTEWCKKRKKRYKLYIFNFEVHERKSCRDKVGGTNIKTERKQANRC